MGLWEEEELVLEDGGGIGRGHFVVDYTIHGPDEGGAGFIG